MTCDRRSFRAAAYRPDNGHCWPTRSPGDDCAHPRRHQRRVGDDLFFLAFSTLPTHILDLPVPGNNERMLLFWRSGRLAVKIDHYIVAIVCEKQQWAPSVLTALLRCVNAFFRAETMESVVFSSISRLPVKHCTFFMSFSSYKLERRMRETRVQCNWCPIMFNICGALFGMETRAD